jgi:AraC-like DNA-binding protein
MLMSDEKAQISDICFEVGFNSRSNFNRQFLAEKSMPPSQFREALQLRKAFS